MTLQQLKAMKLALSTLREVQSETFRLLRNGQRLYAEEKVWNTIIEIKQALADHAMSEVQRLGQEIEQEPKIGCVNHDCDQCKAQPDQEPVIGKWSLREVYFDEDGEPISHRSPPQRKPLTNGEIYTAYITATNQTLRATDERLAFAFARAIEAKLKEKNT
jgi:hypothetical protein